MFVFWSVILIGSFRSRARTHVSVYACVRCVHCVCECGRYISNKAVYIFIRHGCIRRMPYSIVCTKVLILFVSTMCTDASAIERSLQLNAYDVVLCCAMCRTTRRNPTPTIYPLARIYNPSRNSHWHNRTRNSKWARRADRHRNTYRCCVCVCVLTANCEAAFECASNT